jgi:sortase A
MRRGIAAVGRTLITLGLLILLFVAYQLWGTGIITARAQDDLADDFARQQQAYEASLSTTTTLPKTATSGPTTTAAELTRPAPPIPEEGTAGGHIKIEKIGVDWDFVEGTDRADLRKGPGHYPETPMPGTLGNAAIAGHRTTYGAPSNRVDELAPGDKIVVTTVAGKFTYEMTQQLIVRPNETQVVANTPDAQLTLTSCHPKYSASRRIVIKATLVPNESAKPVKPRPPRKPSASNEPNEQLVASDGLSGEHRSAVPALRWGILVVVVGGLWWWAFRRWRHPIVWILGVIPFLIVLFPFYVFLEQALPAGY